MDGALPSQKISEIKGNYHAVEEKIERAVIKSGRKRNDVKIVAVSKLMPIEIVIAGIEAGLRNFGENYPEQAVEKIALIPDDVGLTWHMIGSIQSRKTRLVCENFDFVHSVDRIKIAQHLNKHSQDLDRVLPILVQVNVSGEESKSGWKAWDETAWDELITNFSVIGECANLCINGLMTMPPMFSDPEKTRPFYQRLRRLQGYLRNHLPGICWDTLSIGTSFDYVIAIEEGATMVRLGTTLFGSRLTD